MFELSTKMTQKEFYATGKSPENLGFEVASSLCTLSDAEEEPFGAGAGWVELEGFSKDCRWITRATHRKKKECEHECEVLRGGTKRPARSFSRVKLMFYLISLFIP